MRVQVIKPRRGSLKLIAEAFGISIPAVSQILKGDPRYSSELSRQVRYVAINQYNGKRKVVTVEDVD